VASLEYNTRSKSQPTDTVPKVTTAMESDNSKPAEVEKQYNTRSKSQTTDKDVRE
jgi:hypothetical protein